MDKKQEQELAEQFLKGIGIRIDSETYKKGYRLIKELSQKYKIN